MSVGTQDTHSDLLKTAEQAFAWTKPERIAVAVSGGSDSMAALHLVVQAATRRGWSVYALTVDQRLRPEAAEEASFVARVRGTLAVPHEILVWDHASIKGNVMEVARQARYALITSWAKRAGIGHVVLGHTSDDQAETFLMGLARMAGVDGLTGMRPAWTQDGVTFTRPFIDITRARLRAYLQVRDLAWVDDPTNKDESYTRIKARKVLAAMQPLGIGAKQLARVAENLASVQGVVRKAASDAADRVTSEVAGGLVVNRAAFLALPFELQRRILIGAVVWMSGADHPPRAGSVDRLQWAVVTGKHATLGGCRIRVGDTAFRFLREPKAIAVLEAKTDAPWDNRWHLDGPHAPDLTIRALGEGMRAVADWRQTGFSRDALIVSPSVWRGDTLIAAPLAGFAQGWTATLRPGFVSFLLSH